ncbi:hypothetical protein RUND412_009365 [Rhizina undulata]
MSTTEQQKLQQKADFVTASNSLLKSTKHSDVTLYLGPNELKTPAHYAILSTRTKYFETAKERGLKEGVQKEFWFKEYKLKELPEDDRELIKHPRAYAIADLMDIPDLKKVCSMCFREQLMTHWISDTFVDAVKEVYSSSVASDHLMRDQLAMIAHSNIGPLYAKREFKGLLSENAEFASDLIKLLVADKLK